jgi:hypothetical protein
MVCFKPFFVIPGGLRVILGRFWTGRTGVGSVGGGEGESGE